MFSYLPFFAHSHPKVCVWSSFPVVAQLRMLHNQSVSSVLNLWPLWPKNGSCSHLVEYERWRRCVSRHCWVWIENERENLRVDKRWKQNHMVPPTTNHHLHLGQRPTVKKGAMRCDAVSQHKTVDFQIWDMVVLSISLYSAWSVKAVGNLGWIIIWWAGQQSPDGEIGKIGLEMTTKNPQFPFSKRLKWRAGCRRFKLPNSSPGPAWIYELFMILRPVEITLIYLQQFELCGSGKVGNFGHFKGHYLQDCL